MRLAFLSCSVASFLFLAACHDPPAGGAASASASTAAAPATSGDPDLLPAVELTEPKPSYALAEISDKQLERLVAKAGWTPTVVGKSPAGDARSAVRVAGFKKTGDKQLEAVALLRCGKPDDTSPKANAGEAFYRDGACTLDVAVRLGIRGKSAESKRLLEALLAASPS